MKKGLISVTAVTVLFFLLIISGCNTIQNYKLAALTEKGDLQIRSFHFNQAASLYQKALKSIDWNNSGNVETIGELYRKLSDSYSGAEQTDSALYYAQLSFGYQLRSANEKLKLNSLLTLGKAYISANKIAEVNRIIHYFHANNSKKEYLIHELLLQAYLSDKLNNSGQRIKFLNEILNLTNDSLLSDFRMEIRYSLISEYEQNKQVRVADSLLKPFMKDAYNQSNPVFVSKAWISKARIVYQSGNLDSAIALMDKSIRFSRLHSLDYFIATVLSENSFFMIEKSDYDKALACLDEAGKLFSNLGILRLHFENQMNMVLLYRRTGDLENALSTNLEMLKLAQKTRKWSSIFMAYAQIANIYWLLNEPETALKYHLAIPGLVGKPLPVRNQAILQNGLGNDYTALKDYKTAISCFEKSIELFHSSGDSVIAATSMVNLGTALKKTKRYTEAINQYKFALTINIRKNAMLNIAQIYDHLAETYSLMDDVDNSLGFLNKAIELKEIIRANAPGEKKREFLESQLSTYHLLISNYAKINDIPNLFNATEKFRAKYLAEQIAGSADVVHIPDFDDIKAGLENNQAFLNFIISSKGPGSVNVFVARANGGFFNETPLNPFIESNFGELQPFIEKLLKRNLSSHQLLIIENGKYKPAEDGQINQRVFKSIVDYYYELIIQPKLSDLQRTHLNNISSAFYALFISPVNKYLQGIKSLTIMPDGVLAYIPFESFSDPSGEFMIAKYDIAYHFSASIYEMVKQRNYPDNRKNLLAFGGAVYDPETYPIEMNSKPSDIVEIKEKVRSASGPLTSEYTRLGLNRFPNLPGSLNEVERITEVLKGATLYTGKSVTEKNIKSLSDAGELGNYKIIHFSTHGLVIPEIPDLSALVLTMDASTSDDGFLRSSEIMKLKIKADLVVLSACHTGLGKVYSGDGIVGLTQSFFVAGANGVAASLWQIPDKFTANFMASVYQKFNSRKTPFVRAFSETKREFLKKSGKLPYSNPYYWAAFVYYGQ
jgi:CHAT domain-containing protein